MAATIEPPVNLPEARPAILVMATNAPSRGRPGSVRRIALCQNENCRLPAPSIAAGRVGAYNADMADKPDPAALARAYLDLWERQVETAAFPDPAAVFAAAPVAPPDETTDVETAQPRPASAAPPCGAGRGSLARRSGRAADGAGGPRAVDAAARRRGR